MPHQTFSRLAGSKMQQAAHQCHAICMRSPGSVRHGRDAHTKHDSSTAGWHSHSSRQSRGRVGHQCCDVVDQLAVGGKDLRACVISFVCKSPPGVVQVTLDLHSRSSAYEANLQCSKAKMSWKAGQEDHIEPRCLGRHSRTLHSAKCLAKSSQKASGQHTRVKE